jgi:hydrogenase assembly chaperone HypC/HupF
MCISLPVQILSVSGQYARVKLHGRERSVLLAVDAAPGEWILLYAGVGIKVIGEEEARLGLEFFLSGELEKQERMSES